MIQGVLGFMLFFGAAGCSFKCLEEAKKSDLKKSPVGKFGFFCPVSAACLR